VATEAQPRGRSNRLLMVLGIVIAVVAFLLVLVFGPKGGGGGGPTTNIEVAAVPIPPGTQLTTALLKSAPYSQSELPTGSEATAAALTGKFAAIAISSNTPITDSMVVATRSLVQPGKQPFLAIPKDQVAISIPAGGELQTVGGFIQQDDRVDVLASGLPGEKPNTWKDVFDDVRIMHLGPNGAATTSGPTSSYVLFVPLDVAEDVAYFFSAPGVSYKFVLKSQANAQPADNIHAGSTPGTNTDSFNSKYAVPK